jgi:hypothetical protein
MNRKLLLLLLIAVSVIILIVWFLGISVPTVISEEILGSDYISPITNLTPTGLNYYEITYREEYFYSHFFKFSTVEETKSFFDNDILPSFEELAKNSSSVKSSITIDEFSGYNFKKSQEPTGSLTVLQKNNFVLSFSTESLNEDNMRSVIKWFIETKI